MYSQIDAAEVADGVMLEFSTQGVPHKKGVMITKDLASRMGILERIEQIKSGSVQRQDPHLLPAPVSDAGPLEDVQVREDLPAEPATEQTSPPEDQVPEGLPDF